ncbi:hypothetical protein [Lactobacillus sp. Sy-1]|uniref:hypothetical protein n=1 Tax=Lactobacillus sp. Sy-1 TaxID=2109645 RepID=UPI001C5AB4C3|nr:hypothetical protein [Lactobacillus sp. Sy-1]MBW1606082.1 hypothetical protein [Lactobacillus sp. Sy-1]
MNLRKLLLVSLVFVAFGCITSATVSADEWKDGIPDGFSGNWISVKHNRADKNNVKYGKYYRTGFTLNKDAVNFNEFYYGSNKKYKSFRPMLGSNPQYKETNGTYYIKSNFFAQAAIFIFKKNGKMLNVKGLGNFYLFQMVPKTLNAK